MGSARFGGQPRAQSVHGLTHAYQKNADRTDPLGKLQDDRVACCSSGQGGRDIGRGQAEPTAACGRHGGANKPRPWSPGGWPATPSLVVAGPLDRSEVQ